MTGIEGSGHILLVEDNPDDVELTLRAIRRAGSGTTVKVVRDGAEALDYLFRRGQYESREDTPLPNLMLLDLKMPKVGGLEVLEALSGDERLRLLPAVVLTTSHEERDISESYRLGANSYIRKPVDFKRFTEVLEEIRSYWLELNEPPPNL